MNDQQQTPEHVRAVQERRRSGAAGGHDSLPRKQRIRKTVRQAAIREQE